MNRIFTVAAWFLLLTGAQVRGAEKYDPNPATWEVVPVPKKSDRDGYYSFFSRANYSGHQWVVKNTGGKCVAHLQDDAPPEESKPPEFDTTVQLQDSKAPASRMLKVSDGWIAAYNQGEFGSAVYWFSGDGGAKRKLSDHQINGFLVDEDRIFAVEGLAHLSLSQGSMIEFKKTENGWEVEEFLPLPGSAEAIARVGKGDYVIVTSDALLRVNLDREILMLVPSGEWGGLYPGSVAVDGEHIYIGMRQFVARCKLGRSVQRVDLLVPNLKWLNTGKE